MDKYIDSRFERLEKALNGLIDSVTKYSPSTTLGLELEMADNELSKGLEEVQTHQNNYLRIRHLRDSSAALDSQIRETLSTLANTRKDIVTTQTTTFPKGPSHPIAYEQLLSYARRISKTTMPPAGTLGGGGAAASSPTAAASETQTPGPESRAMTPSALPSSQVQSPAVVNGASTPGVAPADLPSTQMTTASSSNTVLPDNLTQYLNPLSGQIFFPWPLEQQVRAGSLASNQLLTEQGIEPKGYDPVAEEERKQREEDERKEREERERLEQEEKEKRLREERREREQQRERDQAAWRRASIVGGTAGQPAASKPAASNAAKQFQFTNLDDLDDDDDED